MKLESLLKRGLLAASLAACFALPAGHAIAADELNPHADEILRSMSRHLAGLKAFSVSADIGNEILTTTATILEIQVDFK